MPAASTASSATQARRKVVGDFEMNVAFRFGGTPFEVSERGLKLFAKEVLPELKKIGPRPAFDIDEDTAPAFLRAV